MPALSSAYAVAGIGAVSIHTGSAPRTDRWWMRARGFRPCVLTACSLAISSAADASEICDDTAAVSRPPSTSVRSERILSRSGSRGPSSNVRPLSGSISRSKRPSARARSARWCDSTANSSMSSRDRSHFSAIISAERNCDTSCVP